ncbi:MAG: tyrosine-type recombinase/integrase [Roseiarcus sp.]|jgi:integrase
MKLDQASVARLVLPPGRSELRIFDEDLPGFGVRLRAGGKRTWIVQYRNAGGKTQTATLGSTAVVTAARARQAAKQNLADITLGGDPQAKKAELRARAAETLEAVATRFLSHQQERLKARSYEQVETHLTKHWAPLNGLSIHEITRRNVAAHLGKIAAERGPFAANRARTTLSGLFTWAMKEGVVDANPVLGTNRKADEKARNRVLADAELVAIWNACRDDDYGRIVRLLILTGQRRDEVGDMAKSEVSLAARKWNIPRERTKNGRAHEVPLPDLALGILEPAILREGREKRDLIFGDGVGGFSGWSKAKAAIDERIAEATGAAPTPWRLHDLRRTAATQMAELGVLPHVVEAVLNHVSGHKAGVAGVYNLALYAAEKRRALDLWAAHVEAIVAGRAASNVIPLKA